MSLLEENLDMARKLVIALDSAYTECYSAWCGMREEMIATSPRKSEYTAAQDAFINAQKGNASPLVLSMMRDKFNEIDYDVIKSSPNYEDYHKLTTTYSAIKSALEGAMKALNELDELSKKSVEWVKSNR